jgi:DNA-binding response OmpR family regulator
MRILLVEDDPVLTDGLRVGLGLLGFAVEAVGICAGGQASIIAAEFDAIVLDVMLPDGSGLDFLADLRASRNRTPFIVCTALESFQDRMRWLRAGADACIGKPIDLDELSAQLVELRRRSSGNVHLSSKSRSAIAPLTPSPGPRDRAASKANELRRIAARATVSLLVLSILVGSRAAQSEELRPPFTSDNDRLLARSSGSTCFRILRYCGMRASNWNAGPINCRRTIKPRR